VEVMHCGLELIASSSVTDDSNTTSSGHYLHQNIYCHFRRQGVSCNSDNEWIIAACLMLLKAKFSLSEWDNLLIYFRLCACLLDCVASDSSEWLWTLRLHLCSWYFPKSFITELNF
jgi:hypothetical protein